MAQVLVVANRTAESEELRQALLDRAAQGDAKFTLVVPATAHGLARAADEYSGGEEAETHVERAVQRLREAGLDVEGRTGDPDPSAAVMDAFNAGSYDEVIVSTLPTHLSKWLKLDLPRKVAHSTGLPVTHVEGSEVK
jgi:nucleotide-binding universal stress UspA family protein